MTAALPPGAEAAAAGLPARLLAPLAGERPAGDWLRLEAVYDEIKELRAEDDLALPQGVWQRPHKRADWAAAAALCSEVLATRSKDLQVAAWLTEAWIQLAGFPGLERGARLLAGLCRSFWSSLNPPLEEGDATTRLAPIAWMADKLPLRLKRVAVTAPGGEDAQPYGWADWEAGLYLSKLAQQDAAAATLAQGRGMVPQPKFLVSSSLTSAAWYVALGGQLAGALAALDELGAELAARCGEAAPSLTPLKEPLLAVQAFAARVVAERQQKGELPLAAGLAAGGEEAREQESGAMAAAAAAAPAGGAAGSAAAAGETGLAPAVPPEPPPAAPPPQHGAVANRAQAYQRLSEAAEYLLRTEPHSPVPYLVRRAVAWGNLSLAELLEELLAKNADLATLYTLLGIKRQG